MRDLTKEFPAIVSAIREAFNSAAEDFDEFGIHEDSRITEVSAESYPGFFPFTNGGLDCMVLNDLRSAWGSGLRSDFERDLLEPYILSSQNDAASDFIRHRSEDTDPSTLGAKLAKDFEDSDTDSEAAANFLFSWFSDAQEKHAATVPLFPDLEPVPFWKTPAGILQEEFYTFESEYMSEGGEFWYQFRALFFDTDNARNTTGEPEVYIMAGINTDFTYGRDAGLQTVADRTYKLAKLTPERVKTIVAAMAAKI